MQKPKMVWICWLILVLGSCLLFVQPASSQTGDVDGSGTVGVGDVIYLTNYLFTGGLPPPNPIDADVDGSAMINLGDLLQLVGYVYMGCDIQPYSGVSPDISSIEINLPRVGSGNLGTVILPLRLTNNPGPDLTGIVIPFSYQSLPAQVDVILDSISFVGSIVPVGWSRLSFIDPVNEKALVVFYTTSTPLAAGTTGLLANLYFTRTANGTPCCLNPAYYPPTHLPLLFTELCADPPGIPPLSRVLIPRIGKKGDANSDGSVTVSDVVYLIQYLFQGGPPICGW